MLIEDLHATPYQLINPGAITRVALTHTLVTSLPVCKNLLNVCEVL